MFLTGDFYKEREIMKLNGNALGLSLGLIWGGSIFLATIILYVKAKLGIHYQAGDPIGPTLLTLGQFYMGYSISFFGSIVGFIYGFINAYVVGVIIARIYNRFVD